MTFKSSIELLEYFLITFASGQLLIYAYFFNFEIRDLPVHWNIVIFTALALALLNSALPMETLNEKIFDVKDSVRSEVKYSQVVIRFNVTY